MGIEGEDWEIEDRGLTGISPIRGAPWVSCESPLTAGVLAGVGEEGEAASGVMFMLPLQQSNYHSKLSLICFTCSDDIKAVFPTPE